MYELFFSFTKGLFFGIGSKFSCWILEKMNEKEKTTLLSVAKEWLKKKSL
ncbi:hypothetical protein IMZ78_27250 [Bacillus anthracis]|nr:hypothetical protein [Bacillus anthracis]MBE3645962.1 hypothetical protein [Bacillus anthracis]